MNTYLWVTLIASVLCLSGLLFHFFRLLHLGLPVNFSTPAGNPAKAVAYSFTGAMSPRKKESAYLHLPTYIAGIIYHTGTFLSLVSVPFVIRGMIETPELSLCFAAVLLFGTASGLGIFAKRILKKELRRLSNADDYISNLLVTFFQFATAVVLIREHTQPFYFIILSLLLLYIPLGKLKHLLYFFAARIHLGHFYGYRGVWPPINDRKG
jgi:hypothetical protein